MFTKKTKNDNYKVALEGVSFRTAVWGDKTSLHEFRLLKNSIVPDHRHPHEQTGYLISGKMLFNIAGEKILAEPGDSWSIPSNMSHGVEVLEDSIVIEVFSPVRQDYLAVSS